MGDTRDLTRIDHFRRMLATGCAALVFTLGLFAASPLLHARLHAASDSTSDDGCTVVLFANGVSLPVAAIDLRPPSLEWRDSPHARSMEIFLDSPRYLLQPERGPPVV